MSNGLEDPESDAGARLIQLVRRGRSFSGHERNCAFLNTRGTRFANVSAVSGIDFPDDARAIGRVDWDYDGDIDLWISNRNGPQVRFLRNDFPTSNHFIGLRLQGTASNRDAIGARVTVRTIGDASRPIFRQVTAGDGYLAQSSKWLTIGLGSAQGVDAVEVQWPTGVRETFRDLRLDRWYELIEGSGRARPWEPPPAKRLSGSAADGQPAASAEAAIFSMTRLPLPRLFYRDFAGQRQVMPGQSARTTLLVLWASWCSPCLAELEAITRRADELEEHGVHVVALSVDQLDRTHAVPPEASAQVIQRLRFPFTAGWAEEDSVAKLQRAHDYLFGLERPLPVPASFLIDSAFRLAAIYRGSVSLDRVLADSARLGSGPFERRDASVPFPGRWVSEPRTLPLEPFALALINAGYLEDSSEYIQRCQSRFRSKGALLDLIVRLGVAHHERGLVDRAKLHFQMARRIEPDTVGPELTLGQRCQDRGDYALARDLYRQALARNANSIPALNNLVWLLATCPDQHVRDDEEAIKLADRLVRVAGADRPAVLDTLATVMASRGQYEQAITLTQQAIGRAHARRLFRLAYQIEQRERLFQQRQPYRLRAQKGSRDEP